MRKGNEKMFVFKKSDYVCALCGKKNKHFYVAIKCCMDEIIDQIIDYYYNDELYSYGHIGAGIDLVVNDSVEAANYSEEITKEEIDEYKNKLYDMVKIKLQKTKK